MTDYSKNLYYQEKSFYETNKDNFINSLTMLLTFDTLSDEEKMSVYYKHVRSKYDSPRIFRKFNKLIKENRLDSITYIDMIISSIEKNLNGYQEYIKFGKLIEYNISDTDVYYFLKIPKGLNIYHASKRLNLAHIEYNIRYKYFTEPFIYPKYEGSKQGGLNSFFGDMETANLYIPPDDEIENIYRNEKYDVNEIRPIEGMNAFVFNDDVHLLIYEFDMVNYFPSEIINDSNIKISSKKQLFDIFDFSYINLLSLYSSYNFLRTSLFDKVFGICDLIKTYDFVDDKDFSILFGVLQKTINKKLITTLNNKTGTTYKIYHYKKGVVEITDLYEYIELSMNFNKSFKDSVNNFIFEYKKRRKDIDILNDIYTNELKPVLDDIFKSYRGYRLSYYASDWEIFNNMSYIIKDLFTFIVTDDYTFQDVKIYGYIATNVYQYLDGDPFHQEMFLYDPTTTNQKNNQILIRNYQNMYDNDYGINEFEFIQELRKYLTTNLLEDKFVGFHQGHLFEHSVWASQYALLIIYYISSIQKYKKVNNILKLFPDTSYTLLIYIIAFYHDIGKAGECNYYTYEYVNRNPTVLDEQECTYNSKLNTFEYSQLSYHPEKSYEYLTGMREFKFSNLKFEFPNNIYYNKNLKTYFLNIFDKYLNRDLYDIFTISIACHWYFGDILLRNYDKIVNDNNSSFIQIYLDKIAFYLTTFDVKYIMIVSFITMIISLADLLGSHEFGKSDDFTHINDLLSKLPQQYREIYLQINKKLPRNTKKNIPLENTVIRKDYETIIDNSMTLFIRTLEYAKTKFIFNRKNNYQEYYQFMNNKNLKSSYLSVIPKSLFIDINIFMYNNDFMDINEFLDLINTIKSSLGNDLNIVIYGTTGKRTRSLAKYISELDSAGINIYTNLGYQKDDPNYYDVPIKNFYKDEKKSIDKVIILKENEESDSTFDSKIVQPVLVYNYFSKNMNINFKNIFTKGIYLAVWNFYIQS